MKFAENLLNIQTDIDFLTIYISVVQSILSQILTNFEYTSLYKM